MNHLRTILVPVLLAAAGAAQQPLAALAQGFDTEKAFGLAADDDGVPWAFGGDYKAAFRDGAMQFVPALGTAAPKNRPLSFRLATIARGRTVLHDSADVAVPVPMMANGAVTWLRGGVVERYEATADGVAQSFVLASRPDGVGDLVVRGAVQSEWEPVRQPDGSLRFADDLGGVTVGGVTGIDANGQRCSGELGWRAGELELRLPGAFVDGAAYPLTLDPLFGTMAIYGGSTFDDGDVDVAYEEGSDTYLLVWARAFSAVDHDVRALRIDGNGASIGSAISLTTVTGIERRPAVASVRQRQRFFVCWEQGPSVFGPFDIHGRTVDPVAAALGAVVGIGVDPANDTGCSLCGDRTTLDDEVLVAWISATAGLVARPVAISAAGVAAPGVTSVLAAANTSPFAVRLSRSRTPFGVCFAVWSDLQNFATNVAALNYSGASLAAASAGPSSNAPKVGIDGGGLSGLVAFSGFASQFSCRSVTWTGSALTFGPLVTVPGSSSPNHLDVAYVGDRFVLSWEQATATPFDNEVRSLAVNGDCSACGLAFTVPTILRPSQRTPRLATRYSGGDTTSNDGLLVWEENAATPPFQGGVVGQRFVGMLGSPPTTLSAGCGGGGTAGTNSQFSSGNANFRMTLSGGAPLAPIALLLLGLGDPPFGCGCPLTTAVATEAVVPTFGSASHPFPVPCDPLFIGFPLEFQWLLFGSGATPCSLLANVAASSRVRVVLSQ